MSCEFIDLERFYEIIKENTPVNIFAGSAISKRAGLPMKDDIMEEAVNQITYFSALVRENEEKLIKPFKEIVHKEDIWLELFIQVANGIKDSDGNEIGNRILDIYKEGEPDEPHFLISQGVKKGIIRNVITTNFDLLIERAFERDGIISSANFFKLHGSVDRGNMVATMNKLIRELEPENKSDLLSSLNKSLTVFIGYSGSDDDINRILHSYDNERKPLVWITLGLRPENVNLKELFRHNKVYVLEEDLFKVTRDLGKRFDMEISADRKEISQKTNLKAFMFEVFKNVDIFNVEYFLERILSMYFLREQSQKFFEIVYSKRKNEIPNSLKILYLRDMAQNFRYSSLYEKSLEIYDELLGIIDSETIRYYRLIEEKSEVIGMFLTMHEMKEYHPEFCNETCIEKYSTYYRESENQIDNALVFYDGDIKYIEDIARAKLRKGVLQLRWLKICFYEDPKNYDNLSLNEILLKSEEVIKLFYEALGLFEQSEKASGHVEANLKRKIVNVKGFRYVIAKRIYNKEKEKIFMYKPDYVTSLIKDVIKRFKQYRVTSGIANSTLDFSEYFEAIDEFETSAKFALVSIKACEMYGEKLAIARAMRQFNKISRKLPKGKIPKFNSEETIWSYVDELVDAL